MPTKWQKSSYPGVRFREHPSRKHGVKKDRYFIISYRLDGKRKDESLGWWSKGWTAQKAHRELSEIQENQKKGSGPQTLAEKRNFKKDLEEAEQKRKKQENKNYQTFGDFFKKTYLPITSKHKKKYTVKNEKGLFNNWINSEIGHLPFNKIKPFNLEKIKKNMFDSGRAPRSVQYCFAVLRQVWNHARINDIVNEDCPTRKVRLPKIENQRVRFLTQEEAESLLKALKNKSKQVHDMALLSLHTGVRAGELYSLTWGVINLENGSALIRDAKGKPRHIYLTGETKKILESMYQRQASNEFVFKDRYERKIKFISKTFERTVKTLGLNDGVDDDRDKVLFHTLRHTFASWHVQNGTDLYTVKELLGHSTIQLTERYSHLRPDGLKKAARDFDKSIIKNNIVPIEKTDNG
jgi:integrase